MHAYYYYSNILMIYLQTSICIYFIIRLQQEASARSGNNKHRVSEFTSDDDQPLAAKKITEPFDIRFPNLPRLVVEVRPRIQVELPITYQAHLPQTCRDILRLMSVQTNSEDDQRTAKRKAEKVEAEKRNQQRNVVVQERKTCRRQGSR
jgi:hypothetical protein